MIGEGLEGKVSLVTGASRGIGKAIARRLARAGARVVLGARSLEALQELEAELSEAGHQARALSLDVTSRDSVAAAFASILEREGRIDHLVNNAGITADNLLLRMKDEEWDRVLATNLKGAYLCLQAALRPMLKQRAGRVVNVSSVVGLTGNVGQANYASSKAGLIGLTVSAAREAAPRGITVNAVAPGFIETDMTEAMTDKARAAVLELIPLGRVGQPEDVAGTVAFLVSEEAAYVTGQVLCVDGGFRM